MEKLKRLQNDFEYVELICDSGKRTQFQTAVIPIIERNKLAPVFMKDDAVNIYNAIVDFVNQEMFPFVENHEKVKAELAEYKAAQKALCKLVGTDKLENTIESVNELKRAVDVLEHKSR